MVCMKFLRFLTDLRADLRIRKLKNHNHNINEFRSYTVEVKPTVSNQFGCNSFVN